MQTETEGNYAGCRATGGLTRFPRHDPLPAGDTPVSFPNSKGRTVTKLERSACWSAMRVCLVHGMCEARTCFSAVLSLVSGGRRFVCVGALRWADDWCGEVSDDWLPSVNSEQEVLRRAWLCLLLACRRGLCQLGLVCSFGTFAVLEGIGPR